MELKELSFHAVPSHNIWVTADIAKASPKWLIESFKGLKEAAMYHTMAVMRNDELIAVVYDGVFYSKGTFTLVSNYPNPSNDYVKKHTQTQENMWVDMLPLHERIFKSALKKVA